MITEMINKVNETFQRLRPDPRRSMSYDEIKHTRFEWRLMSALLAENMLGDMIDPAMLILSSDYSLVNRVSKLSAYPELMAYLWLFAAVMIVPYVIIQLFDIMSSWGPKLTRLACFGSCVGGVLWALLADLSRQVDHSEITIIFTRNSLSCIALGFILALTLNNHLLRKKTEAGNEP